MLLVLWFSSDKKYVVFIWKMENIARVQAGRKIQLVTIFDISHIFLVPKIW